LNKTCNELSASVVALPSYPYAPWRINCLDKQNQTITHPNGTVRETLPSEIWQAELQNSKGLDKSSVRCWCKSNVQHEWDTEELGPGNGWWTVTKHLVSDAQQCSCPNGQLIMVEIDHNTCGGTEAAEGFFSCPGCSQESSASVSPVGVVSWITTAAILANIVKK